MGPQQDFSKEALLARLSFDQYRVTQFERTERPFDNDMHKFGGEGTYHCIVCDQALFASTAKFNSGTGWPSFWEPIAEERITYSVEVNRSYTKNACARCGAHLGHLFDDRKTPSRQRYCMNSASLRFEAAANIESVE